MIGLIIAAALAVVIVVGGLWWFSSMAGGTNEVMNAVAQAIQTIADAIAASIEPMLLNILTLIVVLTPVLVPAAILYVVTRRSDKADIVIWGSIYGLALMLIIIALGLHFQIVYLWSELTGSSWLGSWWGSVKAAGMWAIGVFLRALDKALELNTRASSWLRRKIRRWAR